MSASLSIVVIGRNEGERLVRCLESLQNIQNLDLQIDVIYVDSASTDASRERAAAMGAHVIAINAERPTAAIGRNAGWQQAQSEFVLFLDGDTILNPEFPRAALDYMSADESLAAVWGHRRETHPERSLYNRILDLDWIYPPGIAEFCGGDVLMRRRALVEAGGYDPALIAGEEPELCRRMRALGFRILHIDHPMTGHDLQMTRFNQYWKRATRAGHAYAEVSSRFRSSGDPFWSDVSRANLIRGLFWLGSFILAAVTSSATLSPWALLLWLTMLLALSVRSAWKTRWKAPQSPLLLFAYGLHSHLQQVPICIGQLQFFLDRKQGRKRRLIEYKESDTKAS
jgi:glycosyltransferase involved in cell wall biosynthesis